MGAELQLILILLAFLVGVALVADAQVPLVDAQGRVITLAGGEEGDRLSEVARLRMRVKALEGEVMELEALYRAAARQRDAARERNLQLAGLTHAGTAVKQIKHAFAWRFHPDRVRGTLVEKRVKAEIFTEFWAEIERIERGAYTSTTT